MSRYPSIDDEEFYIKINKIYKDYKIPKNKMTADEYCKPKEFTLQAPQKFLPNYINPKTPYKSILIYHRIGAGKTCSAIQIAEKWNNSILFIDEIQNMVSESGTYYKELYELIHSSNKNLRIVLMSATPMFDRPVEIALTMNLLKLPQNIPTGKEFEKLFIKEKIV